MQSHRHRSPSRQTHRPRQRPYYSAPPSARYEGPSLRDIYRLESKVIRLERIIDDLEERVRFLERGRSPSPIEEGQVV